MKNEKYIAIITFAILVFAVWFFFPKDTICDWSVDIVYTNGDKETIIIFDSKPPSVGRNGCMYDKYYGTHICGIRSISISPIEN